MGEIADALRRARGQSGSESRDTKLPLSGLRSVLVPSARRAAAPTADSADRNIDQLSAEQPAIVLRDGPSAEVCRHMALRLRSELDARQVRSVAIVSAERGDGKTTIACNLAIALATISRGREVALVDLDLRRPSLARYLSVPWNLGVEDVLRGRATLEDVQVRVEHPALDIYPVVSPQHSAHELIVLPELGQMIADLEQRYEIVIIDTPPAMLVPDASLILKHVATCVPVVRLGKTRARFFRQVMDMLPRNQLLGWIANGDRRSKLSPEYYYGEEPPVAASRWRRNGSGE